MYMCMYDHMGVEHGTCTELYHHSIYQIKISRRTAFSRPRKLKHSHPHQTLRYGTHWSGLYMASSHTNKSTIIMLKFQQIAPILNHISLYPTYNTYLVTRYIHNTQYLLFLEIHVLLRNPRAQSFSSPSQKADYITIIKPTGKIPDPFRNYPYHTVQSKYLQAVGLFMREVGRNLGGM